MKSTSLTIKAQSSVEFIVLITAVLFFFVAFLVVIQGNLADKKTEAINLAIKEVALSIQDEFNLASSSSEGYYREFEIPEEIENLDYEVQIEEGLIYLATDNGKYALTLPIPEVTGQVVKGPNTIKKQNGEILVNS